MGLFDKKHCDICGKEIGLLGNRKLEDGNMCKDCAAKLSPWFTGRKRTALADIKKQLVYREQNEKDLKLFAPNKVLGDYYKFYIDENRKEFVVSSLDNRWREGNPDIIKFSDLLGIEIEIKDEQEEIFAEDSEGNEVSYNPPKYEYKYDFNVTLRVRNEFFDEMNFSLTHFADYEKPNSINDKKFINLVKDCDEIMFTLTGKHFVIDYSTFEESSEVAEVCDGEWYCPKCGMKNKDSFCIKCGTAKPAPAFEPFFCSKCGTKIENEEIVFCPKCGKQLS